MAAEQEFDPTQSTLAANYMRVISHVLQKGVQVGGVVGMGAVVPTVLLYQTQRKGKSVKDTVPVVANALYKTTMTTVALSVAMGVMRMASSPDFRVGVQDRAYRLHYNKRQNRVNLFANAGIAAGGAAAVALLPASAAVVVGGATAGAAAGLLAFALTTPKEE